MIQMLLSHPTPAEPPPVVLQVRLTLSHVSGSPHHLLEESRVLLPATGLDLTAMGFGQELERLKPGTIQVSFQLIGPFPSSQSSLTDLLVVLWVRAAAAPVQLGVQQPYLRVAAMAGSDPAQQLLQVGLEGGCLLPLAVRQVFNHSSDQDLQNLDQEVNCNHQLPLTVTRAGRSKRETCRP